MYKWLCDDEQIFEPESALMMNIFKNNQGAIEGLYSESLSFYFDKEDLFSRLKYISDNFDNEVKNKDQRLHAKLFQESCLHRIFKIHERLLLARHFESQLLVQGHSNEEFNLKNFMYPGLITYLLLTCFDQLGQDGWVYFSDWLSSKKTHVEERDDILRESAIEEDILNVDGNANPKFIKLVYDKYNEIYGVKRAFMNFLQNLLPTEQRERLLSKIEIEIYSVNNGVQLFERYGTDSDKEKWLYRIRNNYTHNAQTPEQHFAKIYYDLEDSWIHWEEIHTQQQARLFLVKESFKKELEKSIIIGIVQTIKNHS